jgi:hypothetical protein
LRCVSSGNSIREATIDSIARGTPAAALTLQSVILQALVYRGTMTPAEALEVVDKAVHAAVLGAKDKSQMEVANVARGCLEGVREDYCRDNELDGGQGALGRDTVVSR